MPKRKTKSTSKPAKKPARRSTPSTEPLKQAKPAPKKRSYGRKASPVAKPKPADKAQPLDLSPFPPESIAVLEKWICLACVLDVFTRHLHLAPRTAHLEVKRFTPSIPELYALNTVRPWSRTMEAMRNSIVATRTRSATRPLKTAAALLSNGKTTAAPNADKTRSNI